MRILWIHSEARSTQRACSRFWIILGLILILITGSAGFAITLQRQITMSAARGADENNPLTTRTPRLTSEAATRNKQNSDGLRWFFGGKSQRGWVLYLPLISNAVGAATDVEGEDFTQAVARWQISRGLRPTGVVDDETWSKMIGEFQSRRIKDRRYPAGEDLVVVAESEFYDPERPAELRQVDRTAYASYKRMIAEAAADRSLGLRTTRSGDLDPSEKFLKIISAFRSREYQDQLRKSSPRAGRAGLAVNSPHFTGRALDLYVGGEPVSTKDGNRWIQTRTPVYKWLVNNAAKFGFRPYFYEPWHWEYVPAASSAKTFPGANSNTSVK